MSPRRIAAVAEATAKDLVRRRSFLVLLALLPLVFYLARHGADGPAIRHVSLGLAWALSTTALFAGAAARRIDPRLRLAGYGTGELLLGRLVALYAGGAVLAATYLAIVALDKRPDRWGAIALELALVAAIAVAFGLVVAAIVPRELEGMLVVISVVGVQAIVDPGETFTMALPFWSSRELITYAVDHAGRDYLERGLVHGVVAGLVLTVAAVAVGRARLRILVKALPPAEGPGR